MKILRRIKFELIKVFWRIKYRHHPQTSVYGLRELLFEQCLRAGIDFGSVDFKAEEWFMKYEWSEKEQDDFKSWLARKLLKDRFAKSIYGYTLWSKPQAEKAAGWLLLNYGWKTKYK